jgi:hypothetical protein
LNNDDPVGFDYLEKLEMIIMTATLNPDEKRKLIDGLCKLTYMGEAYDLEKYLDQFRPIAGVHRTPHTVREQGEALRYAVDWDDFKERK